MRPIALASPTIATCAAKEQTHSRLDDIPGVGARRRKAIMTHFDGDLDRVRQASLEELMAVPGINRKVA